MRRYNRNTPYLRYVLFSCLGICTSLHLPLYAETLAGNCNPLHVNTCALPFPSDLFTESDTASPTGKRVIIPNDVFELFQNETDEHPVALQESTRPETLYKNSSGFSAAAPVLFELERAADESTLPIDGGLALQVFEVGDYNPTPVRVRIMEPARSERVARKDNIVEAWPQSRWKFGTQYIAVLTKKLKPLLGDNFLPSEGVQTALNQGNNSLANVHEEALIFLDERLSDVNMTRDDVISFTTFTIRDKAEVILPLANIIQKVYAEEHEIKDWKVEHHSFAYKAVTVEGKIRLTNYRKNDGSIVLDVDYPGEDNWVAFRLTVPNNAHKKPAPIVLYGHGLTVNKESMTAVDQINAKRNIATLAIDQPNHGSRIESDGGYLLDILTADQLHKVVGLITQSSIDMVSAVAAIEQHISKLDVLPHNNNDSVFPWLALRGKDHIPDIDTSRIFYQGTSMGGVLGSSFLGLSPKIDGAFLHVAGVGITNILTHSILWGQFETLAPKEATGAEVAAYIAMIQQKMDYGDGINFIHHTKDNANILPYPFSPYPLGMTYALNDGVVFNASSIALSELSGLPVVHPKSDEILQEYAQLPMDKLEDNEWFNDTGDSVRMVKPNSLPISENGLIGQLFAGVISDTNALMAHLSFSSASAKEYQEAWTEAHIQTYKPEAEDN